MACVPSHNSRTTLQARQAMLREDKKPMTLADLTRELHLRAVRNKYDELLQVAQREKWSYERFLC